MPAATTVPPLPSQITEVMSALNENNWSVAYRNYWLAMDNMFRTAQYGSLTSAANDTAAASAGVPVNGFYRNGNVVQIRVT